MSKSPDPSSTFPCYSKSIFHCSPTSPASTARQATPSSNHHQSNLCRYSTPQQTVQSHLAALHSHCVCCILSAPTVSFFLLSCLHWLLFPSITHTCVVPPPFVDTTCCTCLCLISLFIYFCCFYLCLLLHCPTPLCHVPPSYCILTPLSHIPSTFMPCPSLLLHPSCVPLSCHIPPVSLPSTCIPLASPLPHAARCGNPPSPSISSFINVPTSAHWVRHLSLVDTLVLCMVYRD